MYAYRPPSSRSARNQRYLGSADRVMLLLGLAAVVAIVISGFATHGESVLSALNTAFGVATKH